MGAPKITDQELMQAGAEIVEKSDSGSRKLKIPGSALAAYEQLVTSKLDNGFWTDIVGEREVIFIFKFADGSTKRLVFTEDARKEIARLCSQLNGDSIEKTSDVLNYLAANDFYKDFIAEHYGHEQEIIERLKSEDFDHVWAYEAEPNEMDEEHEHDYDTKLYILHGYIRVKRLVGGAVADLRLESGNEIEIPRHQKHSAQAGPEGCRYVVAEKHN